jgi:hypothetical protein
MGSIIEMKTSRSGVRNYSGKSGRIVEPRGASGEGRQRQPGVKSSVAQVTKPPSLDTPEKYREFALKHDYFFDVDFPEQYRKIKELPGIKPDKDGGGGVPEDELRFELGEIVYLYHKRHKNIDYFENINKCMKDADGAERLLRDVLLRLGKLDYEHFDMFSKTKNILAPTLGGTDVGSLFTKVAEAIDVMQLVYVILKLITGKDPQFPPRRGQPKVPYVFETYRLIDLWFYLTGEDAVTPKGKTKGENNEDESPQPSTEFVRLCLSMIDSEITFSNVQTCIKRALEWKRRNIEFMVNNPGRFNYSDILQMLGEAAEGKSSQKKP